MHLKYWKGISSLSSKWKAFLNILEISLATAALSHILLRLTFPIRPNSANWALRIPHGMAKMSPSSNCMHTTSLVTTFDFPGVDLVEEARLCLGAGKYDHDFPCSFHSFAWSHGERRMATEPWLQVIAHRKEVNDVHPKTSCKTVALPWEEKHNRLIKYQQPRVGKCVQNKPW